MKLIKLVAVFLFLEFRFSDFELLSTIARGSFGWVMLCKNKEEKYFSIKVKKKIKKPHVPHQIGVLEKE
jgi:hypothetical protein